MQKSLFEQMGGTYRREGDYYIPNLSQPDEKGSEYGDSGTDGISNSITGFGI